MFRQVWIVRCQGGLSSTRVHRLRTSVWTSRNIKVSTLHVCNFYSYNYRAVQLLIFPPIIVSLNHYSQLQYGWTSFVVLELRADSLIALLMLSEITVAATDKMWHWSVLQVSDVEWHCYRPSTYKVYNELLIIARYLICAICFFPFR